MYGLPQYLPINEDHAVGTGITNPYGRSKFFIEEIIKDLCKAEKVGIKLTVKCCIPTMATLQSNDFCFPVKPFNMITLLIRS